VGKTMDSAWAGDNAALLLRGVGRHQVRRGQVLAAPGSLRAHQRFTATLHLLSSAEGGRRSPTRSGYSPQFYVRTTEVSGVLDFGEADGGGSAASASALPGEMVQVTVRGAAAGTRRGRSSGSRAVPGDGDNARARVGHKQ
jgi:elongation factor Tu